MKWLILHFNNSQNWFHVKSDWQENYEISTLWVGKFGNFSVAISFHKYFVKACFWWTTIYEFRFSTLHYALKIKRNSTNYLIWKFGLLESKSRFQMTWLVCALLFFPWNRLSSLCTVLFFCEKAYSSPQCKHFQCLT